MLFRSLGREDLMEEGMAIHSSILAWRIPWTEKLGGRIESDMTEQLTHTHTHTHTHTSFSLTTLSPRAGTIILFYIPEKI